jgi:hypothetical protein
MERVPLAERDTLAVEVAQPECVALRHWVGVGETLGVLLCVTEVLKVSVPLVLTVPQGEGEGERLMEGQEEALAVPQDELV